jgi:hypothetical protein
MYERAAPILRANAAFDIFLAIRNSLTLCLIGIMSLTVADIAYKATPNSRIMTISHVFR